MAADAVTRLFNGTTEEAMPLNPSIAVLEVVVEYV